MENPHLVTVTTRIRYKCGIGNPGSVPGNFFLMLYGCVVTEICVQVKKEIKRAYGLPGIPTFYNIYLLLTIRNSTEP